MKNIIEFICVYKPKQSWEKIKTAEVKFCVNYCYTLRNQNYQEENIYQFKNQQPAQNQSRRVAIKTKKLQLHEQPHERNERKIHERNITPYE